MLIIVELRLVHLVLQFPRAWNIHILELSGAIGAIHDGHGGNHPSKTGAGLLSAGCLVGGHNCWTVVTPQASAGSVGCAVVHARASSPSFHEPPSILLAYPVWLGWGCGRWFIAFGTVLVQPKESGGSGICVQALLCSLLFGLLRWTNLYGDPVRCRRSHGVGTLLSFRPFRISALALFLLGHVGTYVAIATGIDLAEQRGAWVWLRSVLQVYGQCRIFYFLLQQIALIALFGPRVLLPGAKTGAGG